MSRCGLAGINDVDDVMNEWHSFVSEQREKALVQIITEEKLKETETRAFIEGAFRDVTVASKRPVQTLTRYCLPYHALAAVAETVKQRKKPSSQNSRLSLNGFGT